MPPVQMFLAQLIQQAQTTNALLEAVLRATLGEDEAAIKRAQGIELAHVSEEAYQKALEDRRLMLEAEAAAAMDAAEAEEAAEPALD